MPLESDSVLTSLIGYPLPFLGRFLGRRLLGRLLFHGWPCHSRWQYEDHRFDFSGHFTVVELHAFKDDVPRRDDIFGARSFTGAGDLEQKWQVAKIWMAHQRCQARGADRPFVDVGVTVSIPTQFDLGVVEMEATKTAQSDGHIDFMHEFVRTVGVRIVIATGPQVLGVNAETDAFVATGGVDQRLDLVETSTHGAARSRRILDQDRAVLDALGCFVRASRYAASTSGAYCDGFHIRGLCVNICMDVAPMSTPASSEGMSLPPPRTCAPMFITVKLLPLRPTTSGFRWPIHSLSPLANSSPNAYSRTSQVSTLTAVRTSLRCGSNSMVRTS